MKKAPQKSRLSWLSILLMVMITFQCQRDESIEPSSFHRVSAENAIKEDLARQLSKAVNVEGVRSFLKAEAIKRFDGDFDILFAEAAEKKIGEGDGGQTLAQLIYGGSETDVRAKVATILEDNPLLQIYVPALPGNVNATTWNITNSRPLVGYIPSGDDWDVLPAFDSQGKRHNLDRTAAPTQLVILVGENERLMAIPKSNRSNAAARSECPILDQPYYGGQSYDYYMKSSYYELCLDPSYPAPPPPPPPTAPATGCDRDRKSAKDNLNKMIFNSRSGFKKVSEWFDGGLDIEVNIFSRNLMEP